MTRYSDLPLSFSCDVLVLGGGPAGFCAAVAAARTGADTLLVEANGCCGGMATMGLVGPFMTCYDKSGENMIIRGLFEELVDRLVAEDGAIHPSKVRAGTAFTSWIVVGHDHVTPFDPEVLKCVMDDMLIEAGVHVLYHTSFVEPVIDGRRITGVIVSSKAGLQKISAETVIDCTGDADVAFRSGVSCEKGNSELGITQPATLFFRIGNVDTEKLEADIDANRDNFYRKDGVNYRSLHWRVSEARENGDWSLKRVSIGLFRGVRPDEFSINTSRIMGVDATSNESLTSGEMEGRRQVKEIFRFFRKYVPGCENAKLLSTASTLGIRESRHIRGKHVLTSDEILNGTVPEDAVFVASNSVDVHGRFGPMSNEYTPIEHGEYYGVSYGCLVPDGIDALLVAGRSVSATSEAAGAIRVMPPCMALGQAAGTAAALCVREHCTPAELDTRKLRAALRQQKVYLGEEG